MKFEFERKNSVLILSIYEKKLMLDTLDHVYKDIVSEVHEKKMNLIIDMSNVEYIDSFAVGFLMEIFRTQHDSGLKLIICSVNEKIDTLLRMTRVSNVVKVLPDRKTALSELS